MTSEEAIARIKEHKIIHKMGEPRAIYISEALDMAIKALENQIEEEDILKFYYVESEDDYWIGRRLDTLYYAKWHYDIGFVWESSRYLPWGEHVVRPNTLWKEHTYPSEPVEIPFTKWIIGFLKKYYGENLGKAENRALNRRRNLCRWISGKRV